MSNRQFSRRHVVKAGLALGSGLAAGALAPSQTFAASAPVASTVAGKVRGATVDGVHVFKGVPYGASTSGRNRFMPPQAPVPWKGERDAVEYGLSTPQSDPTVKRTGSAVSALIG